MALLGDDADEWQNQINALELARAEAIADQEDAHAWFNMGSSFRRAGHVRRGGAGLRQSDFAGLALAHVLVSVRQLGKLTITPSATMT